MAKANNGKRDIYGTERRRPSVGSNGAAVPLTIRERPSAPSAQAAAMRAAIMDTARTVFCEEGYTSTTFQMIAERAGVTRPLINYYFQDKRALYREIVRSTVASVFSVAVDQALSAPSLMEQLSILVEAITQAQAQDRAAAAFLVTSLLEAQRHPELRDGGDDPLAVSRGFLAWAVNRAAKRGELGEDIDGSAVVEKLLAVVWGIGLYAGFIDGGEWLSEITEQLRRRLPEHLWAPRA
jgi:AcrR family transcriptional regulator